MDTCFGPYRTRKDNSGESGGGYTIILPKSIVLPTSIDKTGLSIRAGTAHIKAQVEVGDQEEIALSPRAMEELGLPQGVDLYISVEGDVLRMGPLVGVFVGKGYLRNIIEKGGTHFRVRGFVEGNRIAQVVLYLFSMSDINWFEGRIRGTYYNYETEGWETNFFPFPDVLYDRGGGYSSRALAIARYVRRQFRKVPHIKRLNSQHYFNKWRIHERLLKYPDVRRYLPETLPLKDNSGLVHMLRKYDTLYIKTCEGSNGRAVARVRKEDDGFVISYYTDNLVEKSVDSIDELKGVIGKFIGQNPAVLQQGVDVINWKDCHIDLRAQVQRDITGRWRITAVPVRVASYGSPITSTRSGSNVYRMEPFFREMLGYSEERTAALKGQVEALVFTIIDRVEEE